MIYRVAVPAVLALAVLVVGATTSQDAPKSMKEVICLLYTSPSPRDS